MPGHINLALCFGNFPKGYDMFLFKYVDDVRVVWHRAFTNNTFGTGQLYYMSKWHVDSVD